ncbi:MAG: bacteriohemerythrin [Treponema sp.]|jgi:methyl-accepting chemotaxis protein|nr:bacteriohemerythrin [Treponema sp.]
MPHNKNRLLVKFSAISLLMAGFLAAVYIFTGVYSRETQTAIPVSFLAPLLVIALALLETALFRVLAASPLGRSVPVMEKAASGDLSQLIPAKSRDEMGNIARSFNAVVNNLRRLVITLENEGENLDDVGLELSSHMNETAGAMAEIRASINAILERTGVQNASVQGTNAAMEQITASIMELNDQVVVQSESVSQSSAAIEEVLANIDSVAGICQANVENVSNLAEASGIGRTGLEEVAADIQEIARESEGLLEINAVIQNISSRTNLLSMNAAIEAAHAGEAGRGFAVVADEIRKLAENASKQSSTIGTVLKKITGSITLIRQAAEGVLGKFEAIDSRVKTVLEQEEHIRGAMEEQSAGSRQILESLEKLTEITLKVKTGAGKMQEKSLEVIGEGKNLETAAAEISNGVSEIACGAELVNSSVEHLRTIGKKNRTNVEALGRAVSGYIISSEFYRWDDSFISGVRLMDVRHKRLFEMVNRLLDACKQGKGREELTKSLSFLADYTVKHFSEEEELQRKYGYPEYEAHHKIHEAFKQTVQDFAAELDSKGPSEELIEKLKKEVGGWLVTHVKVVDLKMAEIIKANGAD